MSDSPSATSLLTVNDQDTSSSDATSPKTINGSKWSDNNITPRHANLTLPELKLPPDNTEIGSYEEFISRFVSVPIILSAIQSRFATVLFSPLLIKVVNETPFLDFRIQHPTEDQQLSHVHSFGRSVMALFTP